MSAKQLERLPAPYRGVRCRREPQTLAEQARAALLVLPVGAALAGLTAAELLGLWIPRSWAPGTALEVVVPIGTVPPRIAGLRCGVDDVEVVDAAGVPVCAAENVFAQLAPRLSLLDLVVLADSFARAGSGRDPRELSTGLRAGRRGVRRARRALRLARAGSASAPESLLRLWLVDAGLPEPELNGRIDLGHRVVYGDLVWRDRKVVGEYHGGYHFESAEQRYADFGRMDDVRAAGWAAMEVARGVLGDRRRRDAMIDRTADLLGVTPLPAHRRGRTLGVVPTRRRRKRPRLQ